MLLQLQQKLHHNSKWNQRNSIKHADSIYLDQVLL